MFSMETFYLRRMKKAPHGIRLAIDGPAMDREMPNALSILTNMAHRPNVMLMETVDNMSAHCGIRGYSLPEPFLKTLLLHVEDHPRWKAQCIRNITMIYHPSDREQAMIYLQQAMELYEQLGDRKNEGRTRMLMATVEPTCHAVQSAKARQLLSGTDIAHLGDIIVPDTALSPAAAEQRLRDSRMTYLRAGDCCEAAIASKRIADLRCAADDIVGAINELETANKLGEQAAPGTEFLGAVKLRLAELYVAREDYGAAENMITEAYVVCLLHENRRVVAQIVYLAATLRFLQGAFQEAKASYEEASRLFRECGETASALKCEENADKARTMLENLPRQEQSSPL